MLDLGTKEMRYWMCRHMCGVKAGMSDLGKANLAYLWPRIIFWPRLLLLLRAASPLFERQCETGGALLSSFPLFPHGLKKLFVTRWPRARSS